MTDRRPDFIEDMIRKGRWERFEHPEKGETLTLFAGKVPILSLHSVLAETRRPTTFFMDKMRDQETTVRLLVELADTRLQLASAIQLLDEFRLRGEERDEVEKCNPIAVERETGKYKAVCTTCDEVLGEDVSLPEADHLGTLHGNGFRPA